ncbi:ankyrin repeat domain-containing protein [Streptomyces sp. NPDC004286]|uniref:ankyrin repeat domain-containing protein n=1 Tax=Streptomyces sp. NPDC004286 TaxID=3364696 RepID=UPI0036759C28
MSTTEFQQAEFYGDVLELTSRLFDLARYGDTGTLAGYLDAGAPVNLTNDKGNTLLMLAAYNGHLPAVVELLMRGADPDRPNDRGQTPLSGAVFKNQIDIIDLLLQHGADPLTGSPSALETARFLAKDETTERLEAHITAAVNQAPPTGMPEVDRKVGSH